MGDGIKGIRGATDVDATRIGGQTEVVVTPDRAKLARYGLAVNDVNTLINEAMGGAVVTGFYDGDKRFDVVVRVAAAQRNGIDAIRALQLSLPGTTVGNAAGSIALGDVAQVEVRQGASRIFRESGSPLVVANIAGLPGTSR